MKKVITLVAYTRMECPIVVDVPDDMTDEELDNLIQTLYDKVDYGAYVDDPDYWETGESLVDDAYDDDEPQYVFNDGKVEKVE